MASDPMDTIAELERLIEHVDASLAWAHRRHGKRFEAAYTGITSLPATDLGARRAVQAIFYANNPGEALMSVLLAVNPLIRRIKCAMMQFIRNAERYRERNYGLRFRH